MTGAQRPGGRGAARHRDVLEAVERAAVSADGAVAAVAPPASATPLPPARVPGGDARAVRARTWRSRATGTIRAAGQPRARSTGSFRFRPRSPASRSARTKARDEALGHIIFNRSVFWQNLTHNFGVVLRRPVRRAGAVFLPGGVRAARRFSRRRGGGRCGSTSCWRRRSARCSSSSSAVPYTWNGGGGSVGNRYFMGAYGAFLFLIAADLAAAAGDGAVGGRRAVHGAAGPEPVRRRRASRATMRRAGRSAGCRPS